MRLFWRPLALADRERIMAHIAQANPQAALELDRAFEQKAAQLCTHPKLHRPGRVPGTREAVIRPNYIMVYAQEDDRLTIVRILHSAQAWPHEPA